MVDKNIMHKNLALLHQMIEDYDYMVEHSKTTKERKATNETRAIREQLSLSEIDLIGMTSGKSISRRKEALKKLVSLRERTVLTAEDSAAIYALAFLNMIPKSAYDRCFNGISSCVVAAAIWILDEIYLAGAIDKAIPLIESIGEGDMEARLGYARDSLWPNELLNGVCYIIKNRDGNPFPNSFIVTRRTAESKADYKRYSYVYKRNMTNRERFNSLVALIPNSRREEAVKSFKKLVETNIARIISSQKALVNFLPFVTEPKLTISPVLSNHAMEQQLKQLSSFINPIRDDFPLIGPSDVRCMLATKNMMRVALPACLKGDNNSFILKSVSGCQDPYAVFFSLIYLLDNNDDIVWLPNCVYNVLYLAFTKLPWGTSNDEEHFSQLTYKQGAMILPRLWIEEREDGVLGATKKDPVGLEDVLNLARSLRAKRMTSASIDRTINEEIEEVGELNTNSESEAANDIINELVRENQRLKTKTNSLSSIINGKNDRIQVLQNEVNALAAELDSKEKEINSLIDSFQVEDDEAKENTAERIKLPYTVQERTVIFGGHDTFLKAIKTMLNGNVLYIDKRNLTFDASIIGNAEHIWVQTNSMSHSFYNKIISYCRLKNKTVNYFTNASANMCVEQLAEKDCS